MNGDEFILKSVHGEGRGRKLSLRGRKLADRTLSKKEEKGFLKTGERVILRSQFRGTRTMCESPV